MPKKKNWKKGRASNKGSMRGAEASVDKTQLPLCVEATRAVKTRDEASDKHASSTFEHIVPSTTTTNKYKRVGVIQGNYNQAHKKYRENAGKQCMANSLASIVRNQYKPISQWTPFDLDRVLDEGNRLYSEVQRTKVSNHPLLLISELPKELPHFNSTLQFAFSEPLSGVLEGVPSDFPCDVVVPLQEALGKALSVSSACFVTFSEQTVAVVKDNGQVFVFDSHSRNASGMQSSHGSSVVIPYSTTEELCEHFQNLAASMGIHHTGLTPFEITGVNINVVFKTDTLVEITNEFDSPVSEPLYEVDASDSDVTISDTTTDSSFFQSLNYDSCSKICSKLGVKNCTVNLAANAPVNLGRPCVSASVKGDGNCFFRAISLAVSGTEENHIRFRRKVVDHLERLAQLFIHRLRLGFHSVSEYIRKTSMRYSGTWATEVEVIAASHLLCSDIYTHSEGRWLKFSAQQVEPDCTIFKEAIYLKHNHSHYDVVLCVSPEDESRCPACSITDHLYTTEKQNEQKEQNRRKRKTKKNSESRAQERRKRRLKQLANKRGDMDHPTTKKRRLEREQYRLDVEFREKKKLNRKLNYTEYGENVRRAKVKKYACDKSFRDHNITSSKNHYALDQVYQDRTKTTSIRKYSDDPLHKEKVKKMSIEKYSTDKRHQNMVKAASCEKYANDPCHRHKVKMSSIQKYSTDSVHREKVIKATKDKYKEDLVYQASTKLRNQKRRLNCQEQNKKIRTVVHSFRQSVLTGPNYVCCVCHRLLFKNQVVKCCESAYQRSKASSDVAKVAISYKYLDTTRCSVQCGVTTTRTSLWICYTCHRKLIQGKMPAEAAANNLLLETIPPELKCLNSLEQHLVSLHIPFMKVICLPKGKQKAVGGPVVCIPSDISKTTSILPRSETEDQIISVKLKRKLSYNRPYKYQFVDAFRVRKALEYLKQNNKWYRDVEISTNWRNPFPEENPTPVSDSVIENTCDESSVTTNENTTGCDKSDLDSNYDDGSQETVKHSNIAQEDSCEDEESKSLPDLDNSESQNNDEDEESEALNGPLLDTCLQPVDIAQEILDQGYEDTICVAPGEGNTPIKILCEESNEAKSFPVLFPRGTPTFHDNRNEKLTLCRYLNNRLMNADNRFAKDTNFIFHAQYRSEIQQVNSSISIAMRKGSSRTSEGKTITAGMLTNKEVLKDIMKADEGWRFLKEIRATPAYWLSSQKDVFAMLRQLGIPTWFASFSSADMRWPEFVEIILRQQGDTRMGSDLDWTEKCDVLRSNPVTVARMFEHRFHNLLKNVILSPAAPIGKIQDYFYRVEFQQRGSPHTHCLFWVENAPKLDRESDLEVAEFIDKYVTCQQPPVDDDLHQTVREVQTHSYKHSNSCRKKGTTCRFNFPRPPSTGTFIARPREGKEEESETREESSSMSVQDAKKLLESIWEALTKGECEFKSTLDVFKYLNTTEKLYQEAFQVLSKKSSVVIKRDVTDIWINPYNTHLLKCWDANMDLQYILDAYSCVVYVVSYMSKAEREMSLLLNETQREIQRGEKIASKDAMRKLGTMYLHNREVSAQEAVYRVCNLRLKECSRKVLFIPVGQDPIKMSLPLETLKQQKHESGAEDENIWMTSLVDRYKNRPNEKEFEHMCLATFCSEFRVLYGAEAQKASQQKAGVYKLQGGLGFIQKRSRSSPAVVRYPRFSKARTPDKYYHSMLQLFLPHRSDDQLKPPKFDNFEHFYHSGAVMSLDKLTPVLQIVSDNRTHFEKESDRLEQAQVILETSGALEDAWAQLCSETEKEREECSDERTIESNSDDEQTDTNIPDLLRSSKDTRREINQSHFTRQEIEPILRSMNKKQAEIFYAIRQWCLDFANGKRPKPFHVHMTGAGGTGKSRVIKSVQYEACRILARAMPNPDDAPVLLTAPTGVAAFNIGASTLHSAFSIRTDAKLPYVPLGEDKINTLRAKFEALQILIIDEISMVDHKMLAYVHGRLRQIKHCRDYSSFGNVSVLAVGDFYQLPPVKGTPLYVENPGFDLWNGVFSLVELDEVMRQQGDRDFAALLNRIRVLKKGESLTTEDKLTLQDRQTDEEPTDALYIFATNAEVDQHNLKTLLSQCPNPVVIKAKDYVRDPRSGKLQSREKQHSKIYNSSLAESLTLAVGARVMLTKNLDVADGLVNGVFGTVTEIVTSPKSSFPAAVYVAFDSSKVGQKTKQSSTDRGSSVRNSIVIEPQEDTVNNKGGVRQQFPLKLAWASTVHKVQGLTVEKAVVSLKKVFAAGQAYVALSRVTSSNGLILQDFNADKLFCNAEIETALSKMTPFMEVLTDEPDQNTSIVMHNVQGLLAHLQDIQQDQRFTTADIICMTETWLTPKDVTDHFLLKDFQLHHSPRSSSYQTTSREFDLLRQQIHGGVGMYVRHSLPHHITTIGKPPINVECMQCFLPTLDLMIAVVYRPPSYPVALFRTNLQHLIDEVKDKAAHSMIMGDFNQNIAHSESSILKQMADNGYTQVVHEATTESGTIIDLVFVRSSKPLRVKILPTYYSVHEAIQLHW